MAVKILHKAKTKTAGVNAIEEKVERLAELKKKLAELDALAKEFEGLKDGLKKTIPDNVPASSPYTFEGTEHVVEFSAMAELRSVLHMHLLHLALGDEVFYAICKVAMKDLDKYLSEEEQKEFVVKERTGARKMSIKEK